MARKGIDRQCPICGKSFYVSPEWIRQGRGKFCSRSCYGKSHQGEKRPYRPRPDRLGVSPANKGKKGPPSKFKGVSVNFNSGRTHFPKGHIPWNKGRDNPHSKGDKNFNWKGGVTPVNRRIRGSLEYSIWRDTVFKRDDYKCFFCGDRGGQLEADHIKPFAHFPDLRFAPSNGRTLCKSCHKKTRTYGRRFSGFKIKNKTLKRRIVEISYKHKLSHLGSNLSSVDIIYHIFKNKRPQDVFFLSAGHYGLALMVVLERIYGYNAEEMFKKHGTHCKIDPEHGILCTNGSLGCVIGIAAGYAMMNKDKTIHVLISDGELEEGSVYEALGIKRDADISNLTVHININGYSAYRLLSVDSVTHKCLSLDRDIIIHHTTVDQFPFLSGLDAHYYVMTEQDYKVALELLK